MSNKKKAVLDYTSTLNNAIMEYEDGNGLNYKHVYGLRKVSVTVGNETLYVYHDRLGSTEILLKHGLRDGIIYRFLYNNKSGVIS